MRGSFVCDCFSWGGSRLDGWGTGDGKALGIWRGMLGALNSLWLEKVLNSFPKKNLPVGSCVEDDFECCGERTILDAGCEAWEASPSPRR